MEERWDNLAMGKVTRCTKEDHHMRVWNALNAQTSTQRILRPLFRRRLSSLAAKPQITNCGVALCGRLWAHSDFTEWPPN